MVNKKGGNNRKLNLRNNSKILTPNNILLGLILLLIVACIAYIFYMTVQQNKKLNNLNKNIKNKNARQAENEKKIKSLQNKLKAKGKKNKEPEKVKFLGIPIPFFKKAKKEKAPIIYKDQSTTIISAEIKEANKKNNAAKEAAKNNAALEAAKEAAKNNAALEAAKNNAAKEAAVNNNGLLGTNAAEVNAVNNNAVIGGNQENKTEFIVNQNNLQNTQNKGGVVAANDDIILGGNNAAVPPANNMGMGMANNIVNNAMKNDNQGGLEVAAAMATMEKAQNNNVEFGAEAQGNLTFQTFQNMDNHNLEPFLGDIEGFGNIGYARVL